MSRDGAPFKKDGDSAIASRTTGAEDRLRRWVRWRLLTAVEKGGGCPTFSDVAKALGVRKQSVRPLVLAAERAGEVEVFPSSCDRRAFQVMLTAHGRRTLAAARMPELTWTLTLLNGLESTAMRSTTHVLQVIAERLDRYEKERQRAAVGRVRG